MVLNTVLIFLILLARRGRKMAFLYCDKVYHRRASRCARPCRASPRRASSRRPVKSGSELGLDTVVSINVMLYTSGHEQDSSSPQQSADKVESVLTSDVDLTDFQDKAKHELEQQSEADMTHGRIPGGLPCVPE